MVIDVKGSEFQAYINTQAVKLAAEELKVSVLSRMVEELEKEIAQLRQPAEVPSES